MLHILKDIPVDRVGRKKKTKNNLRNLSLETSQIRTITVDRITSYPAKIFMPRRLGRVCNEFEQFYVLLTVLIKYRETRKSTLSKIANPMSTSAP